MVHLGLGMVRPLAHRIARHPAVSPGGWAADRPSSSFASRNSIGFRKPCVFQAP